MSLAYALSITEILNWCVRTAASTEQQMSSCERVHAYSSLEVERHFFTSAQGMLGEDKLGLLSGALHAEGSEALSSESDDIDYDRAPRSVSPEVDCPPAWTSWLTGPRGGEVS